MEPVSFLIVTIASLAAAGASAAVKKFFRTSPRDSDDVTLVTAEGKNVTVKVSQLTASKIAELLNTVVDSPPAKT